MIPTRPINFSNAEIAKMSDHQLDLKRLADFLWNDPRPQQEGKFNMAKISVGWNSYRDKPSALTEDCGAAACACGWAVVALGERDLFDKSLKIDGVYAQDWMFGGGWKGIDNTPLGASFRIDHWLKHQDKRLYRPWLCTLMADLYPADLKTYVAEEMA